MKTANFLFILLTAITGAGFIFCPVKKAIIAVAPAIFR